MNGSSKCGQCENRENCYIRIHLNEIIREAIKNAENEVKSLSPSEIDYMIMTDISVIPTRCDNFVSRDSMQEKTREREGIFFLARDFASSAI